MSRAVCTEDSILHVRFDPDANKMKTQEVSGIGKAARVFYLMVNFVVWIFGLILIAVGAFTFQNLHIYAFVYSTSASDLTVGCFILIVLGCLVFLVGFNGVWACVRESVPWMKVYFGIMLVLVLGGVASSLVTLLRRDQAKVTVKENMLNLIKNEYGKGGVIDPGYDDIHQRQECCGEGGPADWKDSYFTSNNYGLAVPSSCCVTGSQSYCNEGFPGVPYHPTLVFSKGCGDKVADFQYDNMTQMGMISIVMVGLETLSLILVCLVIHTRPVPQVKQSTERIEESIVEEEDRL